MTGLARSGKQQSLLLAVAVAVLAGLFAAVSVAAFPNVNDDAKVLVAVFAVVGVSAAVAASWLVANGHLGWAAALLAVASLATPVFYWWPLSVLGLVLVIVLLVRRHRSRDDDRD